MSLIELAERCEENADTWLRLAARECNPNFVNDGAIEAIDIGVRWLNRAAALRARAQSALSVVDTTARRQAHRRSGAAMTPEPSNEYQKLVEAVAQAEAWLRQCSDWLLATDLDMQCPMETDPLDIADALSALKLPHAWNEAVEAAAEVAAKQYAGHGKAMRTERAHNYERAGRTIATAIRKLARPTPPAGVSDNV